MNKYSRKQICGLCEAFEYYNNILSEELQEKISEEFVNEMREMSRFNLGSKILLFKAFGYSWFNVPRVIYIFFLCLSK